jgi:beta-lactamase regulating signal transducer with metallopeptidase domain
VILHLLEALAPDLHTFADWLGTFALHSTLALGAALAVTWLLKRRALALQDCLLRVAMWAPFVSATLQWRVFGSPWRVALPVTHRVSEVVVDAVPPTPFDATLPEAAVFAVASEPAAAVPWSTYAVLGAGLLAILGLLWLVCLWRRLARVLDARRPETDTRVLATAASLATSLGLKQSPRISRSQGLLTPIAFGLLQPEICLPARAANMEPASLRAMLSHELAHLRRWDPAWMWLAALVQALCPWQLLLPVVRRRWSRVVELRCDAEAAARTSLARIWERSIRAPAGSSRRRTSSRTGSCGSKRAIRPRIRGRRSSPSPPTISPRLPASGPARTWTRSGGSGSRPTRRGCTRCGRVWRR